MNGPHAKPPWDLLQPGAFHSVPVLEALNAHGSLRLHVVDEHEQRTFDLDIGGGGVNVFDGFALDNVDLTARLDCSELLDLRAGKAIPSEVFGGGRGLQGDPGAMLMLQGLLEEPSWRAFWALPGAVATPEHETSAMPDRERLPEPQQTACVAVRGVNGMERVTAGIDAIGRHLDPASSLFPLYCLVKPIVALLVAVAVDEGELSLSEPLDEILPGGFGAAEVTVEMLMRHSSGVVGPSGLVAGLSSEAQVLDEVLSAGPDRSVGTVCYSEVAAWALLGRVLELRSGARLNDLVRSRLVDPLDLRNDLHYEIGEPDRFRERVAVSRWCSSPLGGVPVLRDRATSVMRYPLAGLGGYATVTALLTLFDDFQNSLHDDTGMLVSKGAAWALLEKSAPAFDEGIGRVADWGSGFLKDMGSHLPGLDASPASFGMIGFMGASAIVVDLERRRTGVAFLGSLVPGSDEGRHQVGELISVEAGETA